MSCDLSEDRELSLDEVLKSEDICKYLGLAPLEAYGCKSVIDGLSGFACDCKDFKTKYAIIKGDAL